MNTLELLDRLIAFPTVSRDPNRDLIEFVRQFLAHRGIGSDLYWTEDGRNLAFSSNRSSGSSLWMVPAAGGMLRRLAVTGENAKALSIARTGHRLAYAHDVAHFGIWRIPGRWS